MSPRLVLASVLLLGCSRTPELPPGWTTAESEAFQREHEASIGAPLGPLAAVASHYVAPGDTLELGLVDGQPSSSPGPEDPRVRIEVGEEGARCLEGCGPGELSLAEPRTITLGRLSLRTSEQSGTLRVLVLDPEAPARRAYEGLRFFPPSASAIVPARWKPDPDRPAVELSTSRGLAKAFVRAGELEATLEGQTIRLVAYQQGEADGPLLVPLTDETSGSTSYPVGRYLEVEAPQGDVAVLDLNRLTNPWCAYSEHFNCPVPPADNRLPVAIEAGEQSYGEH